jgi:hypothetical protein
VIPAKNGITSAQLQIIMNAAKKDAGSCASAFSAGMIPYRLKFSLKALGNSGTSHSFTEFRALSNCPGNPNTTTTRASPRLLPI